MDGLPRFRRNADRRASIAAWNFAIEHQKKDGAKEIRGIVLAVASDLCGMDLVPQSSDIKGPDGEPIDMSAASMVGLHGHRQEVEGLTWFDSIPKSNVYELRTRGRRVLAIAGAWPWAHVREGKLPRSWLTNSTFLLPLARWANDAVEASRLELEDAETALHSLQGPPPN